MQEDIFVLDIGTRTVMALLARLKEGELCVSHMLYREHKNRAMLDGQIHDVNQVARIISELVEDMRQLSGQDLKRVAVAAAGRSLLTVKGSARLKYQNNVLFSGEDVLTLQLQAVQEAQLSLPKKDMGPLPFSQQYYCVGYSMLQQKLDGINLISIEGQKGQEAEVEVVATFLPRIVVESLQTAVERAGLELSSMTLEPIAVSNLVLNPAMRRLNLVLVDIGAGTSDIAVCGGNAISAFGMVPMAGDEITEALSNCYLLDFNRSEEVKRQLDKEEITVTDVLGIEQRLNCPEIKKSLEPAVTTLASAIAQEIIRLNGKPPQAVLLVGGGSLTPCLPGFLAGMLEIPENRVVVQQANKLQNLCDLPVGFEGPNFITVLGIAYTALACPTMGFITVRVNDQPVRLLNLAQNNVAEALLAGGYKLKDVYGRPGLALTCKINEQLYSIPGKPGRTGSITLNGREAKFSDTVQHGDSIRFVPGTVGEKGQGTFRDVLKEHIGTCSVNGKLVELNPVLRIGESLVSVNDFIPDGCKVRMEISQTVEDILGRVGLADDSQQVWVNQQAVPFLDVAIIKKNGKTAKPGDNVNPGDEVTIELRPNLTAGDFLPEEMAPSLEITVNGRKVFIDGKRILVNQKPANRHTTIKGGDHLDYQVASTLKKPILIDVFNEINFSPRPPAGKTRLIIKVNGQEKEYTYILKNGDDVELGWE